MLFAVADFENLSFLEKFFQENSLGPGQVRRFLGPDLGQNCLQRLLADNNCKELTTMTQLWWNEIYCQKF